MIPIVLARNKDMPYVIKIETGIIALLAKNENGSPINVCFIVKPAFLKDLLCGQHVCTDACFINELWAVTVRETDILWLL